MSAPSSIANGFSDAVGCDRTAASLDQSQLCFQCALNGHSCCQGHDIYVTWGDCRRIFSHTRQKGFYEYRGCRDLAYADQSEDPLWQRHIFRPDGSRRVLKQNADGDCVFLTSSGCRLPLDVRPLVCRLYPHLYSASGIAGQWDSECPVARSCGAAAIEMGIAGVAPLQAVQWHQLLYVEILWEGFKDEYRVDV